MKDCFRIYCCYLVLLRLPLSTLLSCSYRGGRSKHVEIFIRILIGKSPKADFLWFLANNLLEKSLLLEAENR